MAQSVTVTYSQTRSVQKVHIDWQSAADGSVTEALKALNGQIVRVVFLPDIAGTQPTNLYDVVLEDADGMDVLASLGANLANDADTQVVPVVTDGNAGNMAMIAVDGVLTLKVTNAGDTKGGTIIIYLR